MRKVLLSLMAAAAIGVGFTATSVNAAPIAPSAIEPSVIDTSMTESVQWRRCWHRTYTSYRWCRYYGHRWRYSRW